MHFSHMVVHGFDPVTSVTILNSEHKKHEKHGVFNMLIVAMKFQEGNTLLLITRSECVPMADFGSSHGKFSETPKER